MSSCNLRSNRSKSRKNCAVGLDAAARNVHSTPPRDRTDGVNAPPVTAGSFGPIPSAKRRGGVGGYTGENCSILAKGMGVLLSVSNAGGVLDN